MIAEIFVHTISKGPVKLIDSEPAGIGTTRSARAGRDALRKI
jgi:hypothetical protein